MCGINGIIYKSFIRQEKILTQLHAMNGSIIHRGPDDDGVYAFNGESYSLGMGMRRLSIIDLSTGNQPMFSDDGTVVIVFNGEIYNYKKLKESLLKDNISFNTTSDTEVILKLYLKKGVKAFRELDGMFGLSIYDSNLNKVFLARDFFGEKPLYFSQQGDIFYYGSELKAMVPFFKERPAISLQGLNLYFRLTYIPAPFTIYEGVSKLEPNHFLEYDLNSFTISYHPIHPKLNKEERKDISFEEARNRVRELVHKSVVSRSVSDVPIGTFLSGGVDSSIVSFCLAEHSPAKIDTFSVGFTKKSFDETDKSQVVAKMIGSNHHEFIISETDLSSNIDEILLNFDEPFADSSALPTYMVSNRTSEFVKVALTGDGGDEVFGGYNKYYIGKLNARYKGLVPEFLHNGIRNLALPFLKTRDDNRGLRYKMKRALNAVNYDDDFYWNIIALGMTAGDIDQYLLKPHRQQAIFDYYRKVSGISRPVSLNEYQMIDLHLSLEGDMLVKVDRTSMLNSLECRAPFLNRSLLEFTMQLPEDFLLSGWNKKYLLKAAFEKDFPEGFLDRSKRGFGVPVGDWLRAGLRSELEEYTRSELLDQQGIFNAQSIQELVGNHLSGKIDNTFRVWTFYCFQKWYTKIYLNL